MLQAGDELGFGFKAADEVGLVGILGQDDLDGHFALDQGLSGAIDHAHAAFAQALAQGVAADGASAEVFQADLFGARCGSGSDRLGGAFGAGQADKGGALFEREVKGHRQSLGDLDGGTQIIVLHLADRDWRAAHAACNFFLCQAQFAAAGFHPLTEGILVAHRPSL